MKTWSERFDSGPLTPVAAMKRRIAERTREADAQFAAIKAAALALASAVQDEGAIREHIAMMRSELELLEAQQ